MEPYDPTSQHKYNRGDKVYYIDHFNPMTNRGYGKIAAVIFPGPFYGIYINGKLQSFREDELFDVPPDHEDNPQGKKTERTFFEKMIDQYEKEQDPNWRAINIAGKHFWKPIGKVEEIDSVQYWTFTGKQLCEIEEQIAADLEKELARLRDRMVLSKSHRRHREKELKLEIVILNKYIDCWEVLGEESVEQIRSLKKQVARWKRIALWQRRRRLMSDVNGRGVGEPDPCE